MPRAGKRVRIERGLYKTGDLFYACATPPGSRSAMWKRASSSRRGTIPSSCRASSADEAIAYTRIPAGTFRKWVAAGRIPAHGGRRKLFHRTDLDAALGYVPASAPLRATQAA
jgi:excisionase family DNA binding protein